ncbi:hypothetical protein RHS01_10343 [Rhizoctonia solani]|uniref:Integrase catalytic domain-containing protein n=1 Tax=Rhizoctonia solani TaxID=456999 RepID=A0A8H7I3K1_9AGAM|nr:hypothetical protein RHS01_10343 [Rhizoctonia solani]
MHHLYCVKTIHTASVRTTQTATGPKFPWSQIGIDFVGPLPSSKTLYGEFDMICVVVDHLTSMTHLIASRQDYTARDIAEALHAHVFKLHGPPDIIISDRDKLFTSEFHKTINELSGTELGMSTSNHPETDGLVERWNGTLGGIIRTCTNRAQRNWAIQLPTIEFAINSARSETTGFSPFKLNYRRMPRPLLVRTNTELNGVKEHARTIRHALMTAHDAIIAQRSIQTIQANRKRRAAPFKIGNKVFVSTKNMSIPEGKAQKLVNKWMGPVEISDKVVNGTTYRVILPPELMRRGIRPTFHASLLKPYIPDEDRRFPRHNYSRFISLEGDEDEWAVEKITNHRGRGNRAMFEVLWYGGEITWEPIKAIRHLVVFRQYLEILGIKHAHQLPLKDGVDVEEPASDESDTESENLEVLSVQVFNDKSLQGWEDTPSLLNAYIFTKYLHSYICLTTIPQAITIAPAATPDAAVEGEAVEDSLVRMMISYVARSTSSWKRKICEHAPNYSELAGTTLHTEAIVDNKGAMIDVLTVSTKTKTYLLPLVLLNAGGPQARYLGRDIPATASPGAIPAMHLDPNAPRTESGDIGGPTSNARTVVPRGRIVEPNGRSENRCRLDTPHVTAVRGPLPRDEDETGEQRRSNEPGHARVDSTLQSELDRLYAELTRERSLRKAAERVQKHTGRTADFDSHRGSTIDAQLRSVDEPSVNGSDRGSVPPIQSPEPVARDLLHDEQLESIGELLTSMGHGGVTHQGKEEAENQPVELVEQDGDTDAEGEDEETGLPGTTEGADDHPSRAIDLKGKAKAA